MNTFLDVCKLALEQNWCWKITCTTCGHTEWQTAFYEMALGKKPTDDDWITTKRTNIKAINPSLNFMTVRGHLKLSDELHKFMSKTDIFHVLRFVKWPDCLGMIGLALFYTEEIEKQKLTMSPHWKAAIIKVYQDCPEYEFLHNDAPLSWKDLRRLNTPIGFLDYAYRYTRSVLNDHNNKPR